MIITLSTPLTYRDTTFSSLDLDLEGLTGKDLIAIEDNARAANKNIAPFSQSYFAAVAAKAVHLPLDVILALPLKDFTKLTNQVILFLSDTASEALAQESSEA